MRLQLKLGHISTKSKDGTHLLRADVCKATTSIRAQALFTIWWGKTGFFRTRCALLRGGRVRQAGGITPEQSLMVSADYGGSSERSAERQALQGRGAKQGWCLPACPRRRTDSSGEHSNNCSLAHLQDAVLQTWNITAHHCLSAHQWSKIDTAE